LFKDILILFTNDTHFSLNHYLVHVLKVVFDVGKHLFNYCRY